jgi:Family of unknown function (DUF6132)
MKQFLGKNKFILLAILAGAVVGFLNWKFIGCKTGSCPITSHWHTSAFFGGVFGYAIGGLFTDIKKKN